MMAEFDLILPKDGQNTQVLCKSILALAKVSFKMSTGQRFL